MAMTMTIERVMAFMGLDVLVARDEGLFAAEGLDLRIAALPPDEMRSAAEGSPTKPTTNQGKLQCQDAREVVQVTQNSVTGNNTAVVGQGEFQNEVASGASIQSALSPTAPDTGSSFIQVVTWPAHGTCPVAATIVTYSESSNPASPHFADQTKLFSKKQFLPDRFCPAQIAADPNLQTVTVTGN